MKKQSDSVRVGVNVAKILPVFALLQGWRQQIPLVPIMTLPLHGMRACVFFSETTTTTENYPPCLRKADTCFWKNLSIYQMDKEIRRYVNSIQGISRFASRAIIVRIYPVGNKALLEHLNNIPSVSLQGGFSCFSAL